MTKNTPIWQKKHWFNPWYLVVAFGIFGLISVFALRHNYAHMVDLREKVYTADKNNGDVETALEELRAYVIGHMNTNLNSASNGVYPPVQLKYTYERLVAASGATSTNSQVYTDAQKYCEAQIPTGFSGRYRLNCIESYIAQHGGGTVASIPDSLYKFDFVSPTWSPDVAGWSMLLAIVSLAVFLLIQLIRYIRSYLAE
jgi:hypothetical protein